jgi:hypothetical protein
MGTKTERCGESRDVEESSEPRRARESEGRRWDVDEDDDAAAEDFLDLRSGR